MEEQKPFRYAKHGLCPSPEGQGRRRSSEVTQ
jgi:hypothetical protein